VKSSWQIVVGTVAIAVMGCSTAKAPPPPSGATLPRSDAAVRVVLLWEAPVDLDLYVTDPRMETVYFANRKAVSGGVLEKDAVCGVGPRREVTTWEKAPAGRYRVSLDFIDRCGQDQREVGYRLVVDRAGRRQETTGTVQLARFVYQAFEFDLEDPTRKESRP
jgi:hypothetical protein